VFLRCLECRRHQWSCHELESPEVSQLSCVQISLVNVEVCGSGLLSVPGDNSFAPNISYPWVEPRPLSATTSIMLRVRIHGTCADTGGARCLNCGS
jgi:hypothetical protein